MVAGCWSALNSATATVPSASGLVNTRGSWTDGAARATSESWSTSMTSTLVRMVRVEAVKRPHVVAGNQRGREHSPQRKLGARFGLRQARLAGCGPGELGVGAVELCGEFLTRA